MSRFLALKSQTDEGRQSYPAMDYRYRSHEPRLLLEIGTATLLRWQKQPEFQQAYRAASRHVPPTVSVATIVPPPADSAAAKTRRGCVAHQGFVENHRFVGNHRFGGNYQGE